MVVKDDIMKERMRKVREARKKAKNIDEKAKIAVEEIKKDVDNENIVDLPDNKFLLLLNLLLEVQNDIDFILTKIKE